MDIYTALINIGLLVMGTVGFILLGLGIFMLRILKHAKGHTKSRGLRDD